MIRSERFTQEILAELEPLRYSHFGGLISTFFGLSIDFFPFYFIIGLSILTYLRVDPVVLFFLSIACIIYSFFHFYKIFIDSESIVLNKYKISLPKLSEEIKFVFISDTHYGPEYYGASNAKVKKMVDLINSTKCDLVIYGGDFVCEKIPANINRIFDKVKAQNQIGVYGNHDSLYLQENQSYEVPHKFIDIMRESKINLLNNNGFKYKDLYFGGITDLYSQDLDIDKAFEGSENEVRILLSHTPDILDLIRETDDISLIVSGHTHGGQINLPIIGPVLPIPCRNKKLIKGLYKISDTLQLFISLGAGFSKTRMRLGTACEICEITLLPQ